MVDKHKLEGQVLIGSQGEEVNIESLLSDSGMTAVVYKGEVAENQAAIKIVRPGSSKIVREYFRSERLNMLALIEGWKKVYPKFPCVVPNIFAHNDSGEFPFLAMAFINGETLVDILHDRGAFFEKQALEIAIQFGRLLHVLHHEANQTYADIKFENLWLDNTRNQGDQLQLWVSDWNILSNYSEEGVQRDLFFASLYLVRLVLNDTPGTNGIRISGRINKLVSFDHLTLSMQNLLRIILNNNLSIRPKTAVEWVNAVKAVLDLWTIPVEELKDKISQIFGLIEDTNQETNKQEIAQYFQILKASLEVLLARVDDTEVQDIKQKLDNVQTSMAKYSNLEVGLTYFRGSNFDQAIDQFLKGAESSDINREDHMRWYWYALGASQAGREVFQDIRDEVIELGRFHVDGENRRVISGFQKLNLGTLPKGWQNLLDEANIYVLTEEAGKAKQSHDYTYAIDTLKKAIQLQDRLPSEPATNWNEYLGDLHQLLNEAIQLEQTTGQFYQLIKEAEEKHEAGDHDAVVQALRSAILLVPEEKFTIITKWLAYVDEALALDDENAYVYIDEGMFTAHVRDQIKPYYPYLVHYRAAKENIGVGDYRLAFQELRKACVAKPKIETFSGFQKFKELIIHLQRLVITEGDSVLAGEIVEYFINQNFDWAEREFNLSLENMIDTKIGNIFTLTKEKRLTNYQASLELINQLNTFPGVSHPKISEKQEAFAQIRKIRDELTLKAENKQNKINELEHQIEEIKEKLSAVKEFRLNSSDFINQNAQEVSEEFVLRILPGLQKRYTQLLGEGIVLADEYRNLVEDIDVEKSEKYLDEIFSLINRSPKLIPIMIKSTPNYKNDEATSHLHTILTERAKDFLESGRPQKTVELLDYIKENNDLTEEEDSLYRISEKAIRFEKLNSEEEFANLIVQDYEDLPLIYWESKSSLKDFYEMGIQHNISTLRNVQSKSKDFLVLLSKLVKLQQKLNLRNTLAGQRERLTSRATLRDVIKSAVEFVKSPTTRNEGDLLSSIKGLPKGNYDVAEFEQLVRIESEKNQSKTGRKSYKSLAIVLGLLTLILAFIVVFQFIFPGKLDQWVGGIFGRKDPQETTDGSDIKQPEETAVEATIAPTETALPTLAPTPTFTPTFVPTSVYDVSNNILPSEPWIFPDYGHIKYIIDQPNVTYENQDALVAFPGQGYSGELLTLEGTGESLGAIRVRWDLDQNIDEPGMYEVFVSDPISNGGFLYGSIQYVVGQGETILDPLNGNGMVKFETTTNQTVNKWVSLGVYQLEAGKSTWVLFEDEDFTLFQYEAFPIDSILFVKLPSANTEYPLINDLIEVKQENLIYWVDDSDAVKTPLEAWVEGPEDETQWMNVTWEGEAQASLSNALTEVSITYDFPQPLSGPGNKYKIGFWVSPNNQVTLTYKLLINGVSTETIEVDPSEELGIFRYFNVFEVPDGQQYEVSVEMSASLAAELEEDDQTLLAASDVVVITAITDIEVSE